MHCYVHTWKRINESRSNQAQPASAAFACWSATSFEILTAMKLKSVEQAALDGCQSPERSVTPLQWGLASALRYFALAG